jgi:hypothetical protein
MNMRDSTTQEPQEKITEHARTAEDKESEC